MFQVVIKTLQQYVKTALKTWIFFGRQSQVNSAEI